MGYKEAQISIWLTPQCIGNSILDTNNIIIRYAELRICWHGSQTLITITCEESVYWNNVSTKSIIYYVKLFSYKVTKNCRIIFSVSALISTISITRKKQEQSHISSVLISY